MSKAITISFVGAPNSGKSTLASQVNSALKAKGLNSVFVNEYVEEYIARYAMPSTLEHQQVIYKEQFERERMFSELKDFVVCDSASWLSYVYSRQYLDSVLNKQQLRSLNSLHFDAVSNIDYWSYVFYVPILDSYKEDGVRQTSEDEAKQLDKMIKGFLELEKVPFIDLSSVQLENRLDTVIETILK